MPIIIKETPREFTPVPAGTHLALCNLIAEVGVQPSAQFAPRSQVYLRFEIPSQQTSWRDKDGKERSGPMQIGKFYTRSLAPKSNLRADLESWRGKSFTDKELKSFDILAFLGEPCMIGVVHKTKGEETYANIRTIMGPPSGTKLTPHGELIGYDIETDDQVMFHALPAWLQQKIKDRITIIPKSTSAPAPAAASADPDDADPDDSDLLETVIP